MKKTNITETAKTLIVKAAEIAKQIPHFYNGNTKVGDMLTFNKLAGNIEFFGCKGSCGEHCIGCWDKDNWKKSPCYVAKSYYQYGEKIIKSHIVNTLAMRNDPWGTCATLNEQLHRKRILKTVRQHSSGELETVEELKAWMWLAKQNPNRIFYVYTKAYEVVEAVLTKTPIADLPKNYFINISVWHQNGIEFYNKWKHIPTIRAFVYDDETFDYEAAGLHIDKYCPAYQKNAKGKVKMNHKTTCDKCKYCYETKNKVIACLSH